MARLAASSRNRGRTSYALSELDKELDVPTERFDRNAERLAKAMIARGISVTVPPASLASVSGIDSRTQWPSFYDAQIQRLPRLDRAEEFAFARRYEFMKKRVSLALEAAGVDPAAAKKAVSPPTLLTPEDVEKMPRRKRWRALPPAKQKAAVAYAVQAMRERQDLRHPFVQGSLD